MLVLILLLVINPTVFSAGRPCFSRDYGNGGTVCVCNSTYCDTIPRPQPVPSTQFLVYTSNQAGLRFEQTTGNFESIDSELQTDSSEEELSNNEIFIDSTIEYQTIIGWGGAFTDSTGININTLSPNLRESLLRSLFTEDGIEYNLGRVPIGGTDFSTRAYTYDDGDEDPELKNFKLAPDDFNYKIPYILRARNLTNGNLELFCSAWTAPKWMKTNDAYTGYGFIRRSMYQSWANYYLKFLNAYQEQDITFWGMTTGNEPANSLYPFDIIEVVGWPSWLLATWITENLGPTIRASNHSDINIMILDDQRIYLPWYIERVYRFSAARDYTDGIAVHWYLDEYTSPKLLSQTQELFPEKFILATEASIIPEGGERPVILGSWRRGETYSKDIMEDMHNWVTGWVEWNMVLNLEGGPTYASNFLDAGLIVNATGGEFYKQPMHYHLGHFSKFISRGSVRINSDSRQVPGIEVVAFQRPDNATVVVLLNRSEDVVPVNLTDSTRGTANVELTSRSITTVLYW